MAFNTFNYLREFLMNYFFSLLFFIISTTVFANETIKLTSGEITNIGIKVGKIKLVTQSLTNKQPAKVTIPNISPRVISAPPDGVIEIMLVADGDNVIGGQAL